MSVPNVNFFIGYALPESRKDILEGKEKATERQFYSSNQNHDYVQYVETGSKEKIDYVSRLVPNDEIAQNEYNLSVSNYVEAEDTREVIDIKALNQQIAEIVAKENILRAEIPPSRESNRQQFQA